MNAEESKQIATEARKKQIAECKDAIVPSELKGEQEHIMNEILKSAEAGYFTVSIGGYSPKKEIINYLTGLGYRVIGQYYYIISW